MATAYIVIQQGSLVTTPGTSTDQLILGTPVVLHNDVDTGVTAWLWQFVDKPEQSNAILSTPMQAISGFTPDVLGTYLIRLTINNGQLYGQVGAAIKTVNLNFRIPAAMEEDKFNSTRGWGSAVNHALQSLDDGYGELFAELNTRSVFAGPGLIGGGNLSADVTISMPVIATVGSYFTATNDSFILDAYGRITNITPVTRNIIAGIGLVGGGSLLADRTFDLEAFGVAGTYTTATGDQFVFDGYGRESSITTTTRNVNTSSRLTGGGSLLSNLFIDLAISGVNANQYQGITIDAYGRATSASLVSINTASGELTGGGDLNSSRTLGLAATGTAGTYSFGNGSFTFDAYGRETSATSATNLVLLSPASQQSGFINIDGNIKTDGYIESILSDGSYTHNINLGETGGTNWLHIKPGDPSAYVDFFGTYNSTSNPTHNDNVFHLGHNVNAGGGAVVAGRGVLSDAWESYFNGGHIQQERHLKWVDVDGYETRFISFEGHIDDGSTSLFIYSTNINMGSGRNSGGTPQFIANPATTLVKSPDGYNAAIFDNDAGGYIRMFAGSPSAGVDRSELYLGSNGGLALTTHQAGVIGDSAAPQGQFRWDTNNTFVLSQDSNAKLALTNDPQFGFYLTNVPILFVQPNQVYIPNKILYVSRNDGRTETRGDIIGAIIIRNDTNANGTNTSQYSPAFVYGASAWNGSTAAPTYWETQVQNVTGTPPTSTFVWSYSNDGANYSPVLSLSNTGELLPANNGTQSFGSASKQWHDGYFNGTISAAVVNVSTLQGNSYQRYSGGDTNIFTSGAGFTTHIGGAGNTLSIESGTTNISGIVNIDGYQIDPSGSIPDNALVYDGSAYVPQNISIQRDSASDFVLPDTGAHTVVTFTPTVAGNFMIPIYFRVVTASTTLTITVSWTDGSGAQTITPVSGPQSVGSYTMAPTYINSTASAITVTATAGTANQIFVSSTIVGI